MREMDYDNLTDEDKDWMRSRNMEIPEDQRDEDDDSEEPGTPQVIQKTAANDGVKAQLPEDYNEWTNQQLRDELGARELPTGGNKAQMVERLQEDDESEDESDEDEDAE